MAFKRSGVRFPSPPYRLPHRLDCAISQQSAVDVAGIAQLVEHNLAKVGVAGSSPVSRSARAVAPERWHLVVAASKIGRLSPVYVAGWSSLVARRAHNPEVVGSNPTPAMATRQKAHGRRKVGRAECPLRNREQSRAPSQTSGPTALPPFHLLGG